jgi:hypothetical protein
MNFSDVRKKYPEYSDLSDAQLAKGLHEKFYSDMPYDAFAQKVGVGAATAKAPESSLIDKAANITGEVVKRVGGTIQDAGRAALIDYPAGFVRGAGSIGATAMRVLPNAMGGDNAQQNAERRRQIDAGLQSMGANPDSMAYGGGKLAAEVLGSAGAGSAVAKTVATQLPAVAQVAPRLLRAIDTAGMSTGARALPSAADLGLRVAGGAVSGGAQAGLIDPSSAATGAAIGGVLPAGIAAAGKVGNAIGSFTARGANRRALDSVRQATGDPNQLAAAINTHYPKGAENIPLSAAAISGSPQLAQLEQASRLRNTEPWYAFDQKHGKAVFDNVLKHTGEADEVASRAATRSTNWQEAWAKAKDAEKPKIWKWGVERLRSDLDQAMLSAEASNPSVRAAVKQIADEIDRVGDGFSPSHLQQLRAQLNGKVNPLDSSLTLKTAPRDNPAIISIKNELDSILNASTGGKWQKVLSGYSKDSKLLEQSRAAEKVRQRYVDKETGRTLGRSLDPAGDVPIITESGLGGAMNAARGADKVSQLSPEAQQGLEATLEVLRKQGIVQGVKRSASAGGGSDTASNLMSLATRSRILNELLNFGKSAATYRSDKRLAQLLSNPDELAIAIQQSQLPKSNVSPILTEILSRSAPALASPH